MAANEAAAEASIDTMTVKWLYIDNKMHVLMNTDRIRNIYIQRVNAKCWKVQCCLTMPNGIVTCAEYQDEASALQYLEAIKERLEQ